MIPLKGSYLKDTTFVEIIFFFFAFSSFCILVLIISIFRLPYIFFISVFCYFIRISVISISKSFFILHFLNQYKIKACLHFTLSWHLSPQKKQKESVNKSSRLSFSNCQRLFHICLRFVAVVVIDRFEQFSCWSSKWSGKGRGIRNHSICHVSNTRIRVLFWYAFRADFPC